MDDGDGYSQQRVDELGAEWERVSKRIREISAGRNPLFVGETPPNPPAGEELNAHFVHLEGFFQQQKLDLINELLLSLEFLEHALYQKNNEEAGNKRTRLELAEKAGEIERLQQEVVELRKANRVLTDKHNVLRRRKPVNSTKFVPLEHVEKEVAKRLAVELSTARCSSGRPLPITVPALAVQRVRRIRPVKPGEKRFFCDRCPSHFNTTSTLRKHTEDKHFFQEWRCAALGGPSGCGRIMPSRRRLVGHWRKAKALEKLWGLTRKQLREKGHLAKSESLPLTLPGAK